MRLKWMAITQKARNYIKTSSISQLSILNSTNTTEREKEQQGPTRDLIFRRSARFQSNKGVDRESDLKQKSETHREKRKRKISLVSNKRSQNLPPQFHFTAVSTFSTVPNPALLLLSSDASHCPPSTPQCMYHFGNNSRDHMFLNGNSHALLSHRLDLFLIFLLFPLSALLINSAEFSRVWWFFEAELYVVRVFILFSLIRTGNSFQFWKLNYDSV